MRYLLLIIGLITCCIRVLAQPAPWQQGLDLGHQAMEEQRYVDARQWYLNALKEAEARPPGDSRLREALDALGNLYQQWSHAEGETFFHDLIARWDRQWGAGDPRIADGLMTQADLLADDEEQAVPLLERAQAIREKSFGKDSPILVETLGRLAEYAAEDGEVDTAAGDYTRAIDIKLAAGQRDLELASLHYALTELAWDNQQFAEAATGWQQALGIYQELDPDGAQTAYTLNRLAWAEERLGQYLPMVAAWERAAAIREKLSPSGWELLQVWEDLARAYVKLGRWTEAEVLLQRDIALRQKTFPGSDPGIKLIIAELYRREERLEEAETLFRQVAASGKTAALLQAERGLGMCELAQGNRDAATACFVRAQTLQDTTWGFTAPQDEAVIEEHLAMQEFTGVTEQVQQLLTTDATQYPPDHPATADHLLLLARAYAGVGEKEKAREAYVRALAMWKKAVGSDHPALVDRLLAGVELANAWGNRQEAADLLARAVQVAAKSGSVDVLLALARYYRGAGDEASTRQYCDRAIVLAATTPITAIVASQTAAIQNPKPKIQN